MIGTFLPIPSRVHAAWTRRLDDAELAQVLSGAGIQSHSDAELDAARYEQRARASRDVARAFLIRHGASEADAESTLAAAGMFPGNWAYTSSRDAAAVYEMPAGTYDAADTAASERAIMRLRRTGGR